MNELLKYKFTLFLFKLLFLNKRNKAKELIQNFFPFSKGDYVGLTIDYIKKMENTKDFKKALSKLDNQDFLGIITSSYANTLQNIIKSIITLSESNIDMTISDLAILKSLSQEDENFFEVIMIDLKKEFKCVSIEDLYFKLKEEEDQEVRKTSEHIKRRISIYFNGSSFQKHSEIINSVKIKTEGRSSYSVKLEEYFNSQK